MITNEQQFKDTIDKIATLDLKLQELETARDQQIQNCRDNFAVQIEPLQNVRKALASDSGKWLKKHRKTVLGSQKSGESPKGIFGFRLGTPGLAKAAKDSWDMIVARAKRFNLGVFVRTVETFNKEKALAEATDEDLEKLGLRRTQTERFFVKPKDPGATTGKAVA